MILLLTNTINKWYLLLLRQLYSKYTYLLLLIKKKAVGTILAPDWSTLGSGNICFWLWNVSQQPFDTHRHGNGSLFITRVDHACCELSPDRTSPWRLLFSFSTDGPDLWPLTFVCQWHLRCRCVPTVHLLMCTFLPLSQHLFFSFVSVVCFAWGRLGPSEVFDYYNLNISQKECFYYSLMAKSFLQNKAQIWEFSSFREEPKSS